MKSKKRIAGVAGLLASALMIAGCSGSASSGGSDGETVINWWMLTTEDSEQAAFDELIDNYEEANDGVEINLETRGTDQHKEALRTSAGSAAAPDIFFMWTGQGLGGEFVDLGTSMDLTDAYEDYGWEERFSDATLDSITQYGQYDGVPWTQASEVIYYHKSHFEDAGIAEEPQTYDELVAAAEKLEANGVAPISFGGTVQWHVMRFLDSLLETECGAEKMDELLALEGDWGAESCVDDAFSALKVWGDDYFNEGYLGLDNLQANQAFYTGDAAMAYEGDWFNNQLVDNGVDPEEIGVFPFPTDTGRLYGLIEAVYVNPETDNADEVLKFLDYLTSDEVQSEISGVFGANSVNVNVDPSEDNPLNAEIVEIAEAAEGTYINNDQSLPLDVSTEYWRIQDSVLTGGIAADDAGAEMQSFIDNR